MKSKFERRHYEAVAAVVRSCHPDTGGGTLLNIGKSEWEIVKFKMANMFEIDNPRFDRAKFDEACEP